MSRVTTRTGRLALSLALAFASAVSSLARVAEAEAPASLPAGIDPIDIPPEHDPLAHAWDRPEDRGGFYARASIGFGYVGAHLGPAPWDDTGYDARIARGFGMGFNLDLGGVLKPWVALHLSTHAGVLWDGDVDREFAIDDNLSARTAAYGVAPAVTFFVPYAFYFTGAFGVGIAHNQYNGYDETTKPGFYMNLVAGNDLYVGRHVSFGLQFQIVYMMLGADREEDEARVREFLFGTSVGFDSL
jgi:hypothetical protein